MNMALKVYKLGIQVYIKVYKGIQIQVGSSEPIGSAIMCTSLHITVSYRGCPGISPHT